MLKNSFNLKKKAAIESGRQFVDHLVKITQKMEPRLSDVCKFKLEK